MSFTTADEKERDKIIAEILSEIPDVENKVELGKRIVITGKGGVGKTVISAVLAYLFAEAGLKVLAVDEDPQMNLPFALGVPFEKANEIIPLNKQLDYIEEKTGARPGTGWGLFFRLNPDVSDVVDRFGLRIRENLNLLVMGTFQQPGVGCACPENDLLQAVVNYINLRKGEVIIMDTEAGLEHFGRAIAKGFHHAVIVSEPTFNSIFVLNQAVNLAKKLGIPHIHLVFNKVRDEETKVREILSGLDSKILNLPIYFLPWDENVFRFEPLVEPLIKSGSPFVLAIKKLFKELIQN
ncbi:CO dehydrogenase maturation factor [Candidatus Thermokryptus mobilis]|uniref:CO dehydrogenase maturation factor n=1 Tax=Candidatus Thermokryptus mobilis TaxID=1643428 RepID=A0A0S4N293_9BACT|nr:AAA family ATPase [Candidatus Thermokryptus mobilis]CUU04891.1 CO dehydrogenase maturation factor [Candidatus Thermokryptus mobilis]